MECDMDMAWSDEDVAFRDEIVAFLDEKLTRSCALRAHCGPAYADHEASMEWQAILHERGWAAPRGRSSTADAIGR